MDGNDGNRAVPVQAGIELTQQVHLKASLDQLLLDERGDLKVDFRFGEGGISIAIFADRARVVACVPRHNANPQLWL